CQDVVFAGFCCHGQPVDSSGRSMCLLWRRAPDDALPGAGLSEAGHARTSLARHSGQRRSPVAAGTWSWRHPGVRHSRKLYTGEYVEAGGLLGDMRRVLTRCRGCGKDLVLMGTVLLWVTGSGCSTSAGPTVGITGFWVLVVWGWAP